MAPKKRPKNHLQPKGPEKKDNLTNRAGIIHIQEATKGFDPQTNLGVFC